MPSTSVRGPIRAWIEKHAALLGEDVLEIGSRLHDQRAWWLINRDLAKGRWTGTDLQPGHGVDVVADIHQPPQEWIGRFTGIVCSEVLEHVQRPWVALPKIRELMQPGALLIVTAPACFPLHAFPDDYYRYTESGMRTLLEDAGFGDIKTASSGSLNFMLDDHGAGYVRRTTAMHTFGTARA